MDINIEQIIRDYLPQVMHMSLGTSKDNRPWVCEVHFVYDENLNLYFRSKTSRRHSIEIALNPNVAGNVVTPHKIGQYPLGVYFEGIAQELEDEAERMEIAPLFKNRLKIEADILVDAKDPEGHHFYKITVASWFVFGKLGDAGGQKYELKWNGGKK